MKEYWKSSIKDPLREKNLWKSFFLSEKYWINFILLQIEHESQCQAMEVQPNFSEGSFLAAKDVQLLIAWNEHIETRML
jgi:hypothetical protein